MKLKPQTCCPSAMSMSKLNINKRESEELLTIADEIGKIYCTLGNVSTGPSSSHSAVLTIMERFYPKLKLGPIIVSIEAQPGYGASAVDFHITKNNVHSDRKIWLLVAQTDNIETSANLHSTCSR